MSAINDFQSGRSVCLAFSHPIIISHPSGGHTMNELCPLDYVFSIYFHRSIFIYIHECLVQCVSSPLKNAALGLRLVRDLGVVIYLSKLPDFFLMMFPKYVNLAFSNSSIR